MECFDELSPMMKSAKRWILWKRVKQEGKKDRKIPFYANGTPRNGNTDTHEDMAHFATFEGALRVLSGGKYAGIGFALGPDGTGNYWQGVDFDGLSKHPNLGYLAEDLQGYVEHSPSGDGVHAIGYGRKFTALGSNSTGIEAYCEGRYFTVTGQCAGMGEPVCLADYVENILKPLHDVSKSKEHEKCEFEEVGPSVINNLREALFFMKADDRELWIKMGMALKTIGDNGRALWLSWSATSESFDPLNDTKTWDSFKPERTGYRAVFAEAQRRDWINPNARYEHVNTEEHEDQEAQEWKENLSGDIDYIIPFPGIARDIQQWILSSSMYPQPAISFAATMCVLSVCIGRNIAYENIKGNLMFICMAESGEGKDFPFKSVKKILDAVGFGGSVYSRMASGAALMEAMQESPSMLFHVDEFGNYLSSINGKNANQYSKEIVDIMTLAYTDADGSISGKKTKGNDAIKIKEPNLCVFGLSTERQLFDGLRTSDLANGSLARYSLLFGLNGLLPVDIKHGDVPLKIINDLIDLSKRYEKSAFIASTQLNVSEGYRSEKFALVRRIKEQCISLTGHKEAFKPMYNRIAFRSVQQAMLVDQCKDIDVLKWFEALELKSFDVFMKKFLHLGSDNETEKHFKDVENAIKKAGTLGIAQKELLSKTRHVETGNRNRMLIELVNCGAVFVREVKTGKPGPVPKVYFWSK